jgi:hypothetical protein
MLAFTCQGQVLISLLFGDKLNSDKLEFGLEGGFNWSDFNGDPNAKFKSNFNLGFYFNLKVQEQMYIHTGVMVKSTVGARGLPVYSTGVVELDSVFSDGGSVTRQLNYFHVPILFKYMFDNRISIEGGPMIGLRSKAKDNFVTDVETKEDLVFVNDINYRIARFDFGLMAGVGYKILNKTGLNLALRYYYGFVDVDLRPDNEQLNSSIYASVGIPIGAGKAKSKREAEANGN